jgi:hypothetical protein
MRAQVQRVCTRADHAYLVPLGLRRSEVILGRLELATTSQVQWCYLTSCAWDMLADDSSGRMRTGDA